MIGDKIDYRYKIINDAKLEDMKLRIIASISVSQETTLDEIETIVRSKLAKQKYECIICMNIFKDLESAKKHTKNAHPDKIK